MKEDFTERLLDASLKEYSRVDVPEHFAERLARREKKRTWWWMIVPAAAALAMVLVFWPHPATVAPPTVVAALPHPLSPSSQPPAPQRAARVAAPARPRWRTLSAVEIAHLDFPDSLLAPMESTEPAELEVPELRIKPLPEVTNDEQENRPAVVPGPGSAAAGPGKA